MTRKEMYYTGDTSGTRTKTEGKRKNVFYIEKRAFLCGNSFFSAASKKGDCNALKPAILLFALCFSTGLACCMYILTFLIGFRSMVMKKTKIKKNFSPPFSHCSALFGSYLVDCFLVLGERAIC
jgi:hypothetical protein